MPWAPIGFFVDLPGMPERAVITEAEDFEMAAEAASDIERGLEPRQCHCRLGLGLLVPTLTSPHAAVRHLLPAITKRPIPGRKDLQVAVGILLHEGLGKIAVLGWFGKVVVPGF